MRTDVLGVGFDPVTMEEAVSRALKLMERRGTYICTPNPEIVMLCRKDHGLVTAVNGADMVIPDGIGVVMASKALGRPLPERVAGYDLFTEILQRMEGTVYLLGGRPGIAEAAADEIEKRCPRVTVVGCRNGYDPDEAAVIQDIEETRPGLLAVCLGAGKQERFMAAHRTPAVGLMMGLGGALDVLAGNAKRAPACWRDRGFEWLWRLLREPRRIKRQICLPAFLLAVRKQRKREWEKAG